MLSAVLWNFCVPGTVLKLCPTISCATFFGPPDISNTICWYFIFMAYPLPGGIDRVILLEWPYYKFFGLVQREDNYKYK